MLSHFQLLLLIPKSNIIFRYSIFVSLGKKYEVNLKFPLKNANTMECAGT